MHNTNMNVKLLIARKQRDMTQDALAELAKVPQADLSRIESRGWIPPKDIQERIAEALHVSAADIFPATADIAS